MKKMFKMVNQIQKYDWGSQAYIANLLGIEKKDDEPWAELWMSAHKKAPSFLPSLEMNLDQAIEKNPQAFLSKEIAIKFDNKLPYLFKVLSSDKPLSIQAHPNLMQARKGFSKENELGIALTDYHRNYKDDNHKPELICALTEFHAMCGFRPAKEIIYNFSQVQLTTFLDNFQEFKDKQDSISWKKVFTEILTASVEKKQQILNRVKDNISLIIDEYTRNWIDKMFAYYPEDIGAISPLFLNTFVLKPGQAVFLEAGLLHAYLRGTGIEIMANSDNVLRGGLTSKNVDVEELTSILQWGMAKPDIQEFSADDKLVNYKIPIEEFSLQKLNLKGQETLSANRPIMLLVINGQAELSCGEEALQINKGESVFITGEAQVVVIKGNAQVFIASTN